MTTPIEPARLHRVLIETLAETFAYGCSGIYLNEGTSIFETLAGINAEQASVPVGGGCATLAAQVDHVRFYIDVLMDDVHDTTANWDDIWERVSEVTPAEWENIIQRLRLSYRAVMEYTNRPDIWAEPDSIRRVVSILTHTAYHLGEIRQALCTLR